MISRQLDPGPSEIDTAFCGRDPGCAVDGDVGCRDAELYIQREILSGYFLHIFGLDFFFSFLRRIGGFGK
jgi:hypothetical protein